MADSNPQPGDMKALMQQAQEMQKIMQEMQDKLTGIIVIGTAGGSLVRVHMNAAHRAVRVEISKTLFSEDEEMLEDLLVAAINDGEQKIEEAIKHQMMEMTRKIKLPEGLNGEGQTH